MRTYLLALPCVARDPCQIHLERRDDLRDRYEALVKELDSMVANNVFSDRENKRSRRLKEEDDEHGINFSAIPGLGGAGAGPRPGSRESKKKPSSPPAREAGAGLGHVVEMTRRALKGAGAGERKHSHQAPGMGDIGENGEDGEDEEEEEAGSKLHAGVYRRLQEMEDRLAKERVKVRRVYIYTCIYIG